MTDPNPPQPGYYPPPPPPGYQPAGPVKKRGGLATAALVLGIIGLVLAIIPFANFAAYPLVILAIIFGLLARAWGKAKAGLILGILGLIATIGWTVAIASAVDDAVNKNHTVAYTVTGTGKASISYAQYTSDDKTKTETANDQALPWTKTFDVKGSLSAFSVSATVLQGGSGELACNIKVDGKVAAQDTSTGSGGIVTCTATGYDGD